MIIYKTTDKDLKEIAVIELSRCEPVLWFHQGIFCIIPIEIIKNAYDQVAINLKVSDKTSKCMVYIKWDQGIPVDPKVGYALMGE